MNFSSVQFGAIETLDSQRALNRAAKGAEKPFAKISLDQPTSSGDRFFLATGDDAQFVSLVESVFNSLKDNIRNKRGVKNKLNLLHQKVLALCVQGNEFRPTDRNTLIKALELVFAFEGLPGGIIPKRHGQAIFKALEQAKTSTTPTRSGWLAWLN